MEELERLVAAWPDDVGEPASWPTCEALLPDVDAAIVEFGAEPGPDAATVVDLANAVSVWLLKADDDRAEERCEAAAALAERLLGPVDPGSIDARSNLASCLWGYGDLGDAVVIEESVLADCERELGPEHARTLTARNNLAASYQSVGRWDEAIALKESVLAVREQVLGPDDPATLTSRSNLATGYWTVGRREEAIVLMERVAADSERVLGPAHANTQLARQNLATARLTARLDFDARE